MRLALCFVLTCALGFAAEEEPQLLQKPTLSKSSIVFSYAGDLWSVPRTGGNAIRLTSGVGVETDPVFSPDGSRVAFTGEYDGNIDVFVIPAAGGVPKRLTWHPAPDSVLGWTPDGKNIVFSSPRSAYSVFFEMFTVPVDGGSEEKLPFPTGYAAAYSPDAKSIAYEPERRAFAMWKHYRGGESSRIWLGKLADSEVVKVPRTNSNDFNPMWAGERVYFLSDRNGAVGLFYYDLKSKAVREAFPNHGLDLKSASLGSDAIVYEQFGGIYLYDLKGGAPKRVPIRLQADLPELRARLVNVSKSLASPAVSPNGARAVFSARGEIITVPAEFGDPRDLTNTPGIAERDPQWSPDGKSIAYLSDESGEYALHIRPQNGGSNVTKIDLNPGFYQALRFSPDSKKIALVDSYSRLWFVDLESHKQVQVAQDHYQMRHGSIAASWSPDSKWIAYSRVLPNSMSAVYLYSLSDGKSSQVTDGMSDAIAPVFDRDGKYLYFLASTNSGESLGLDIHAVDSQLTSSAYLVVLDKNEPSPFAPRSDEEKTEEEKSPEGSPKKPEPGKAKTPPATKIDLDGIDQRILAVPLPARDYAGLQVGKANVLLALERPVISSAQMEGTGPGGPALIVHRYDLKARKSDVPLAGVSSFVMAETGEKALYRQGDNWTIASLHPMSSGPAQVSPPTQGAAGQGTLKTGGIEVRIDPTQEWAQMYREAFRVERYWFYDPSAHGLDLKAAEISYRPYLKNVAARSDLTYLFQEMLGGLVVSHLNTGGGDIPEVKHVRTGLLGADYDIANGRYRFARVFNGDNWNPQMQAPLTQPGVNVKTGDYLLAVNGRDVTPADNIYSFFEGLAGKNVVLKVSGDASGSHAREVTVIPVANESGLRNRAWIEDNRKKVNQLSGGTVAYVYMPNTAQAGLHSFNREFYAQIGKQAAIIDERFNGGGLLGTDIAEILNRKILSAAAGRTGADLIQPQGIFGPKAMLINEWAGSGGDAMPWYFKRAGVGKLVGMRTWGGLVGMAGSPPLIDGGMVTAPSSAIYNPLSGEWEVENVGVSPDIEVEQDPALVRKGGDPQLERAVHVVMDELKKNPLPTLRRPPYPNYHKLTQTNTAGSY